MATVKLKLRLSSDKSMEGRLFYQIIHRRIARQIRTKYKLYQDEWDHNISAIRPLSALKEERRAYLETVITNVAKEKEELCMIIKEFDNNGTEYTSDNVIQRYSMRFSQSGIISFSREVILQLNQIGKPNTAERYAIIINSFKKFLNGNDITLDEINQALMIRYENFLKSKGLCSNTTSFYMRGLRAIYYRAVDKGYTSSRTPFKHVYTGIGKTVKRAVPLSIVRKIRNMDLKGLPELDFARDIFMFSFYTRGMSFIDIAYLKKKNLNNGILRYNRQKTGQPLAIRWENEMQEIVEKYDNQSEYMLPIISNPDNKRKCYKSAAHRINNNLKKIGSILGLGIPLTTYVARHSWASIAKSKNIPVTTISDAMGHDSEKTTRIYLASLDTSDVDNANSSIIKDLI